MSLRRMTDIGIASQIGAALRVHRLQLNLTQDEMASEAGISIPTYQRLEKGHGTLASLIAALRRLRVLDLLIPLVEPPTISPMAMLKRPEPRQRASRPRPQPMVGSKP